MQTKLIIGIGNPDPEYQNTRHNVGFMFLDYIAKKAKADHTLEYDFKSDGKLGSLVAKYNLKESGKIIYLRKPQTYVNKSGEAVKKIIKNYNLKPDSILVVQDDLDVPFGKVKLSFDKNSGGHKGVESIMKALKTKKFYRLRIGLAKPALQKARRQTERKRDEFVRNYVLSKFSKSESEKLKEIFKEGYEKLNSVIK